MVTENQIKDQIAIGETYAENIEYWDGESEYFEYHNGYIHALQWVIGLYKPQYDKEDI